MHIPVLLNEVIKIFDPRTSQQYIDATVNSGGHARAIAERTLPEGKVIGVDWDCDLIKNLENELQASSVNNIKIFCENYANLQPLVRKYNLGPSDGILLDLGFSSYHVETSQRGFSFLKNEKLDMRYSPDHNDLTASKIINTWPEKSIEDILRTYGEERFARRIARRIVASRTKHKIQTTGELAQIVSGSIPYRPHRNAIHPATRTFQALRIAVNSELENLEHFLAGAAEILKPKGIVAIISFHSLEDRVVKNFFKHAQADGKFEIITKKPVVAQSEEVRINPRARSAKLRAARKI